MYIIRGLFWFAIVAVLMPRGPDLGIDLQELRTELAAQSLSIARPDAIASLRGEIAAARIRAEDPVRIWRDGALKQLSRVRVELAQAARASGHTHPELTSARNPLF